MKYKLKTNTINLITLAFVFLLTFGWGLELEYKWFSGSRYAFFESGIGVFFSDFIFLACCFWFLAYVYRVLFISPSTEISIGETDVQIKYKNGRIQPISYSSIADVSFTKIKYLNTSMVRIIFDQPSESWLHKLWDEKSLSSAFYTMTDSEGVKIAEEIKDNLRKSKRV